MLDQSMQWHSGQRHRQVGCQLPVVDIAHLAQDTMCQSSQGDLVGEIIVAIAARFCTTG